MPGPPQSARSRLPDHLVLLGLMGVGKSTVGRELAARLGWPLSDSDEVITQRYGATVRELNERLGTDGMHRLETEHLLSALAEEPPSVICAAASVVDNQDCRRALRREGVYGVWLKGRTDTLVDRFTGGPHRPILGSDLGEMFRQQIAERSRRFAAVAKCSVEVEHRSAEDIAREILAALGSEGPAGRPA